MSVEYKSKQCSQRRRKKHTQQQQQHININIETTRATSKSTHSSSTESSGTTHTVCVCVGDLVQAFVRSLVRLFALWVFHCYDLALYNLNLTYTQTHTNHTLTVSPHMHAVCRISLVAFAICYFFHVCFGFDSLFLLLSLLLLHDFAAIVVYVLRSFARPLCMSSHVRLCVCMDFLSLSLHFYKLSSVCS